MLSKSNVTGDCYWHGNKITETEYDSILRIIRNKPVAPDGYDYRLTADLEWEIYEVPVIDDEAERQAIRDEINKLEEEIKSPL